MSKLAFITTFAAGAAIGSGLTYFYVKKKYDQLIQEEIDSVKEAFRLQKELHGDGETEALNKIHEEIENEDLDEEYFEEEDFDYKEEKEYVDEYNEIISEEGYISTEHRAYNNKPYVITPDEFNELAGYEAMGMSYYADGKLADEKGKLVDIDNTIGQNNLRYFGEYEEDVLHVRNPILKTDYEVFLDPRKYSEVYPGRV